MSNNLREVFYSDFWNIYKNLLVLFNDRKYTLTNPKKFRNKTALISHINKNNDNIILTATDFTGGNIIIIIPIIVSGFVKENYDKTIKLFSSLVKSSKTKFNKLILITETISSAIKKYINKTMKVKKIQIEAMGIKLLNFPLTTHQFVPKHILLLEREKKEFLDNSTIKLTDMPIIDINDPVVLWFGAKENDVFQIVRHLERETIYVTHYRRVWSIEKEKKYNINN
jgi:DNA-directed RNA polymerase subunit H (RpoH/RPB5)